MRDRKRERKESETKTVRQPILERVRAGLLRSFRGQGSEKMFGVGQVQNIWDPREGQHPFWSDPSGLGTAPHQRGGSIILFDDLNDSQHRLQ